MKNSRKFSFICGHDSNMTAILSALGTYPYELPKSLEGRVPFGVKLVIENGRELTEFFMDPPASFILLPGISVISPYLGKM